MARVAVCGLLFDANQYLLERLGERGAKRDADAERIVLAGFDRLGVVVQIGQRCLDRDFGLKTLRFGIDGVSGLRRLGEIRERVVQCIGKVVPHFSDDRGDCRRHFIVFRLQRGKQLIGGA